VFFAHVNKNASKTLRSPAERRSCEPPVRSVLLHFSKAWRCQTVHKQLHVLLKEEKTVPTLWTYRAVPFTSSNFSQATSSLHSALPKLHIRNHSCACHGFSALQTPEGPRHVSTRKLVSISICRVSPGTASESQLCRGRNM
jgi:hypothetical protein